MKRVFILLTYLVFFSITPFLLKAQNSKFSLGFSTGYSFGVSNHFKQKTEDAYNIHIHQLKPWLPLYLNLQFYLSPHCAIQAQIGGQQETESDESFWFIDNSTDLYIRHGFTPLIFINIIYSFDSYKKRNLSPYLSAGVGGWLLGILFGTEGLDGNNGLAVIFKTTGGIKYPFSSHWALNLGVSSCFNYTSLAEKGIPVWISLNIGLEYRF